MSNRLLVRYIWLALSEDVGLARVPNQLMQPDGASSDAQDEEGIDEFSGVGAIAGYSAPLGADPDKLGRKKNASKRKQ